MKRLVHMQYERCHHTVERLADLRRLAGAGDAGAPRQSSLSGAAASVAEPTAVRVCRKLDAEVRRALGAELLWMQRALDLDSDSWGPGPAAVRVATQVRSARDLTTCSCGCRLASVGLLGRIRAEHVSSGCSIEGGEA
ncbi:unnamed protein product [Prorocentrum cordatum]|uniref:Uncharacterized protein n=1 Tax=Prorocentrum cordatum TaxID=2364126 RepID=A0ABN9Y450_9DINO|nr:unnamed protein product [Polarella glacialis]